MRRLSSVKNSFFSRNAEDLLSGMFLEIDFSQGARSAFLKGVRIIEKGMQRDPVGMMLKGAVLGGTLALISPRQTRSALGVLVKSTLKQILNKKENL